MLITKLFMIVVRLYQYVLSPFLRSGCRFYPTCSHYALDALAYYSWYKAVCLITKRLIRCHPFVKQQELNCIEYDPVK